MTPRIAYNNIPWLMYAKLFASLYQGTMRGRSHEILVFTNLLAHADAYGVVDKHFLAIAQETGLSELEVERAIENLEAPDPASRSPEHDGRRLIRLDEHRNWGWQIVNYLKYRRIRKEEDRRQQNREAQERWRNRVSNSKPSVSIRKPNKPKQREKQKADVEEQVHLPPSAVQADAQKESRPRNPLLDALVSLDGSDPVSATKPAFARAAKALQTIREVSADVTPDEIRRRARNYAMSHPTWELTCTALASHWSACDQKMINGKPAPPSIAIQNLNAACKATMRQQLEAFDQEQCNQDKEPIR